MNAIPRPGRTAVSECRGSEWSSASGPDHDAHVRYVGDDEMMWVAIGLRVLGHVLLVLS